MRHGWHKGWVATLCGDGSESKLAMEYMTAMKQKGLSSPYVKHSTAQVKAILSH
jgi:hypothetical protein